MGTQAGAVYFDGRPIEEERRRLVASLEPPGGEGVTATIDGGALLVTAPDCTWTDERICDQPVRSAGGLVMTWDGRLDNRDDLLLRFGRGLKNNVSDAAIALLVFEREGPDGLCALIGDWSLAVWDGARRTLYLARDYMGVRPLYYVRDEQTVLWSSSLGELAQRAGRVDTLDEGFVARYLTLQFSTDVTPYTGIRAVPTASCMRFTPNGDSGQRFWHLQPSIVRYRDKRRYEEQLRALWIEAVGARVRTEATVWAELSGGLDSSAVVCMADALVKARRVAATAVQPLSYVPFQSPEGDERPFIAEVEAHIGAPSTVLSVEQNAQLRDADFEWVTPAAPRGVRLATLHHVREREGRVVLSGRMGDAVMGCLSDNSVAVLDDLADGNITAALLNMRAWSRACRKPLVEIGGGLMLEPFRALLVRDHLSLNDAQLAGFDLLSPRLKVLAETAVHRSPAAATGRLSTRRVAALVLGYAEEARLESPNGLSPISYTYPFAHRPLVEFMMAIPGEELSAPGEPRSLMRRAFAGLVPERVVRRTSKGHYSPAAARAVKASATSLLPIDRLQVVRRGWIDRNELEIAVRRITAAGGDKSGGINRVLRLEEWLTARDRRAPAAIPEREEVTSHGVRIA